MVIANVL